MLDAINELSQRPQWVCWAFEGAPHPATGKRRKMPKNPRTGGNARSDLPATWASYHDAIRARNRQDYAGIGYMFAADDPYCGVDLDNCINADGTIKPLAAQIITALNSYAEISPSGCGIKVFCCGDIPKSLKVGDIGDGIGLEIYGALRYFTITEDRWPFNPESINDAQYVLNSLLDKYRKADHVRLPVISHQPPRSDPDETYPEAWAKGIANRVKATAASKMALAPDGNKHNARLEAGTLLGGYSAGFAAIGYGWLLTEDEALRLVYESNPPQANQRAELDTIMQAIEYGTQHPIAIDRPAPKPTPAQRHTPPSELPMPHNPEPASTPAVLLDTPPTTPDESIIWQAVRDDESGDARLFHALYGNRLAYDHSVGQWFLWNGHSWTEDVIGLLRPLIEAHVGGCYLDLAKHLHQKMAATSDDAEKQKLQGMIASLQKRAGLLHTLKRLNIVETLARFYFGLTGNEWDTQPYLLAVQNGVIDLRTGDRVDGCPCQYLRKVAPICYDGLDTPAPRWEQFLAELFEPGSPNDAIPAYLARLFGYGTLGLVREAILPVLYGAMGRNGKDTMLKAIVRVLGPHVGAMGNDVLIASGRGRDAGAASAHLMDLHGKRMVWASEPEDGQRFSIGQAKLLTGGGQINARAPHAKRNVTWNPTHLMMLLTNHKPKAPADDEAFWARVQLIPFQYRFLADHAMTGAPNERLADPDLDTKLAAESAGILAWLVRGCLEYQRVGIQPPAVVQAATEEYRDDEDTFGDFLGDCCVVEEHASASGSGLFSEYQTWAVLNGYSPMNKNTFGKRLKLRFSSQRTKTTIMYYGVGLRNRTHENTD